MFRRIASGAGVALGGDTPACRIGPAPASNRAAITGPGSAGYAVSNPVAGETVARTLPAGHPAARILASCGHSYC
jgi:hypothetical protein